MLNVKGRRTSAAIAAVAFVVLSALSWGIFSGLGQLYKLESRNEAEQTMNALFTGLRIYDDFGSAIESNDSLKKIVVGIGIYATDSSLIYSWGTVPGRYTTESLPLRDEGNQVRMYQENPKNRSLVLILRPTRMIPPPPLKEIAKQGRNKEKDAQQEVQSKSFMFSIFREADVIYLELRQPQFWYEHDLLKILFPIVELLLAAVVFAAWFLVVRNREFQEKLEKQKNLVVLGTAASTLAHEIKNPLLAIRLQTSILEKTLPSESKGELGIINAEVDRLSRITTRVNDYLRDPKGFPKLIDPAEIAAEVGVRLCGRQLVKDAESPYKVLIDPERYRSILENLLQNAIESGSPVDDIAIKIDASEGRVAVDILDRGSGIEASEISHVFDPFFTTKSKGTGIGLAICERFAEEAGGTVVLENRKGGGAMARLSLPEAAV